MYNGVLPSTGDTVEVVDASGSAVLSPGDTYEVTDVTPHGKAVNISGFRSRFRSDRFRKVDPNAAQRAAAIASAKSALAAASDALEAALS